MDPISAVLVSLLANFIFKAIQEVNQSLSNSTSTHLPTKQDIEADLQSLPIQVAREFDIDEKDADQLRIALGNNPILQTHVLMFLKLFASEPEKADFHLKQAELILDETAETVGFHQEELKSIFKSYLHEGLLSIRSKYGQLLIAEEHRILIENISQLMFDRDQNQIFQLIPYVLLGKWKSGSEGDWKILKELGKEGDPEQYPILSMSNQEEFFRLRDNIWNMPYRETLLSRILPYLTPLTLSKFESSVLTVLGESDPSLELPVQERYLAPVTGLKLQYSDQCREGLAEGLFIVGKVESRDIPALRATRRTLPSFIKDIVAQLLDDSSWKNWASLARVLPILAESAPDVFLRKLERSLEIGDEGVLRLFSEGGGSYGYNPHVELIWAMERLAWLPDSFEHAVLLLTRLSKQVGDIKISNPIDSLVSVFRPFLSQTVATQKQKDEVLDLLVERYPEITKQILISMIPSRGQSILNSNSQPKSLENYEHPDKEGINRSKYWLNVNRAVHILLSESYGISELVDLIKELPNLQHPQGRDKVIESLGRLSVAEDDESGSQCWIALREVLYWQNRIKREPTDISEELLIELNEHYERLTPNDPVKRYSWLFSSYPQPPFDIGDIDPEKSTRITELKDEAIRSLISVDDWKLELLRFIDSLSYPHKFGRYIGEKENELPHQEIMRLSMDSLKQDQFIHSFLTGRLAVLGKDALLDEMKRIYCEDGDIRKFAITLNVFKFTADLIPIISSDEELEREYWMRFPALSMDPNEDEIVYAMNKLFDFEKYSTAIIMLSRSLHYFKLAGGLSTDLIKSIDRIIDIFDIPDVQKELVSFTYEINDLLKNLNSAGLDKDRLALLEIKLFYLLEHTGYSYPGMTLTLTHDPDQFVELVKWLYRSEDEEEERELDEEAQARAQFAFGFLHRWHKIPGYEEGRLDVDFFKQWIESVHDKCVVIGRGNIVYYELARILVRIPDDLDDIPLHSVALELIEEFSSSTLDEAIMTEIMNSRGVVTKALGEGGEQEEELASKYLEASNSLESRFARTKQIFRRLAEFYMEDARKEDIRAEEYSD